MRIPTPVCKAIISKITLPQPWIDAKISASEVVIDAKPVDALATVRGESWLAKKGWHLEGAV